MRDQKAAEIYQTVLLVGFLVGFGFTFLIYLKSFLTGESGFVVLILQFFFSSLVGSITMMIAGVFAAPIVAAIALFDRPRK